MPTANEDIRDSFIRHQVGLLRLQVGLRRRFLRALQQADPELRSLLVRRLDRIAERPFTAGTARQVNKLRASVNAILSDSYADAQSLLRRELRELGDMEIDKSLRILTNSSPVALNLKTPGAAKISEIVSVRPHHGNTVGQYVAAMRAADLRRTINTVRIGLIQGFAVQGIVQSVFGLPRFRNRDGIRPVPLARGTRLVIANTVQGVTNGTRQQIALLNKDVFTHEVYFATLDSRTTVQCFDLDGEEFPVGEGPLPPIHHNCRSTRIPVLDGGRIGTRPAIGASRRELEAIPKAERAERIRELVGTVPASVTGESFLKSQSKQFQNEVLGVEIARAFRAGKVDLSDLVDSKFRPLTLDQLRRTNPEVFTPTD